MLKLAFVLLLAQAPRPGRPVAGMAMKPVVCRAVDEAKGKSGEELAQAIEQFSVPFVKGNYALAALLPGDPPIACFRSLSDPSKLPMGAR
jgi:hypothetical protein